MKRIVLITLLFCLGLCATAQETTANGNKNVDPYDITLAKDGVYIVPQVETYKFKILIEVKDFCVTGIYRDSICEENRLQAHVFIEEYTDLGRHIAWDHRMKNIPLGYRKCNSVNIAHKQDNPEEKYWVVLYGKKKHCWYER